VEEQKIYDDENVDDKDELVGVNWVESE